MAVIHVRSNSFPSRENPFVSEVEENMCRISSSRAASSSQIYEKFRALQDLQDSVDKLLLLPQTRQTFSQDEGKRLTSEITDASLRLLDLCSTAQDALAQTKDSVREVMSSMRRKTGVQETMVKNYYASRKMVKKVIKKGMESLKAAKKFDLQSPTLVQDQEIISTFLVLKKVETVTLAAFESLFAFLSGSSTKKSWSLVSRLVKNKRVGCHGVGEIETDMVKVDAEIRSRSRAPNLHTELKDLDLCIQDMEENIETLYKRLIKTRVSLLNILNQ